jgi:histidinol-phosphate/aromatic aminotransferase/cobyric acid decarboxylase-like protein
MARLDIAAPDPIRDDLFPDTSHSPSLGELVGYERAADIVDFCFIANPYYPTPQMIDALQEALPALIKCYPSSNPATSQQALAAAIGVDQADLIVGNGATELIVSINSILVDRIGVAVPTFSEYIDKLRDPRAAELFVLDRERDYRLDLREYLAWGRERGVGALLVINPGNPTGQLHSLDDMLDFMEQARDLDLVIVDESFIDFAGAAVPSLQPHADRFENLVIVRSMSKHYGVPGLRLGFCYSRNHRLLESLRRLLPTWNLNSVAEYFLTLLPATVAAYEQSLRRVTADVRKLQNDLAAIEGLFVYPTGSNFVLVRIEGDMTATELQARLLADHQMYVRDCSNKVGMDDRHVRVASQGRVADARLVEVLRDMMMAPGASGLGA